MDVSKERNQHLRQFDTGQYLTSVRTQQGITLTKSAKGMGISTPYLSEIEKGLKLPSDQLIRTIADFFSIDEDDLFQRFGKIPLFAREQFEQLTGLQKVLADIRRKHNLTEDQKQKLYDSITKLYSEFLETLQEGD